MNIVKHYANLAWSNAALEKAGRRKAFSYLSAASGGNLALSMLTGGSGGFLGIADFAIDVAGAVSFIPILAPLRFFVCAANIARSAIHLGLALYCLYKKDTAGAVANVVSGCLNLASVLLPFEKPEVVINRARKVLPMTEAVKKKWALEPVFNGTNVREVFSHSRIKAIRANVTRLEGELKIEDNLVEGIQNKINKLEEQGAERATKILNREMKESNPQRTRFKANGAKEAPSGRGKIKPYSSDVADRAKTEIGGLAERTKIEFDKETTALKELNEKIAKQEKEKLSKYGERQLKALKKTRDNKQELVDKLKTNLKEFESQHETFVQGLKDTDELQAELKVALERKDAVQKNLDLAIEARDEAVRFHTKYKGKISKLTLGEVQAIKEREAAILKCHNDSLNTSTFNTEDLLREWGRHSYGDKEAERITTAYKWVKGNPTAPKRPISTVLYDTLLRKPVSTICRLYQRVKGDVRIDLAAKAGKQGVPMGHMDMDKLTSVVAHNQMGAELVGNELVVRPPLITEAQVVTSLGHA